MKNDKIDLVYKWVDGSDKEWSKQKNKWYEIINGKSPIYHGAASAQRWRDNGELKYSLRSVAECVPWVNHIYIVTGFNQVPKWLNTNNPKITIVPHEEIMPKDALPTFNSTAIDLSIPNIKNLSEHFLLLSDDMFFNKPLKPDFFYDNKNRSIIRYNSYQRHSKNIDKWIEESDGWTKRLIRAAVKIEEMCRKDVFFCRPSHGVDPYIKSSMIECINHPHIKSIIEKSIHNKFRTEYDLPSWLSSLYDIATGRARTIHSHAPKFTRHKLLNFLYNTLYFKTIRNSNVTCENVIASQKAIKLSATFCINDGPNNTHEVLQQNTEFLQKRFPNKCEFEK